MVLVSWRKKKKKTLSPASVKIEREHSNGPPPQRPYTRV